MKAQSTDCIVKSGKMRPKGGGPRRKIWKASKDVWKPCNPLKSQKPPKLCLEKLGAKHASFGEAWKKTWRAPLFRHRWRQRPPIELDRDCEERNCEATQG